MPSTFQNNRKTPKKYNGKTEYIYVTAVFDKIYFVFCYNLKMNNHKHLILSRKYLCYQSKRTIIFKIFWIFSSYS